MINNIDITKIKRFIKNIEKDMKDSGFSRNDMVWFPYYANSNFSSYANIKYLKWNKNKSDWETKTKDYTFTWDEKHIINTWVETGTINFPKQTQQN